MKLIDKKDIANFKIESVVVSTISIDSNEFYNAPGDQHYRLLGYLSQQFNNSTIIDIGTHRGSSAAALSSNPTNTVHSFDIISKVQPHTIPNLNLHIADLWDKDVRAEWKSRILSAALIVLDIDPHPGVMEYEFYEWLKAEGYKGLLLCDDIWYFKEMRDNFWFKIPSSEKLDITCLGHWSGTGLISFVEQPYIWETLLGPRRIGEVVAPSPWTIVTAYFDLTKCPDASPSIKARPKKHYLDSAYATLSLDQPLVVFCDSADVDDIISLRPPHLTSSLRVYPVNFETLPLTQYRSKIIENRIKNPYQGDDRNTASYYLFCMSRYVLLQNIMRENPFGSTHFAWLNICIERMGYKNISHLEEVFSGPPRDRISSVYIDYIPEESLVDVKEYYQFGRCSLCSGFFTGSAKNMKLFTEKIIDKFMYYLELGYGHADEQLYSPVYFENRDLFELYYGDYFQMITNYRGMYDNAPMPISLVIPKSAAAGDWLTCFAAADSVIDSVKTKKCVLSESDYNKCMYFYERAAMALGGEYLEKFKAGNYVIVDLANGYF
uniref:Methyltransferase n=1 Tax=viral metagenome TaxID=1070528 RepID=A0A6C0K065_9ZZZZ